MIMLKQVNEYLANQVSDTMNDYYPPALWLDTETGTYGDAKQLAIIDVSQWGDDEIGVWETMTDTERQGYGIDYLEALKAYGYSPDLKLPATPSEYMREIGR